MLNPDTLLDIGIVISHKDNQPIIELRRTICDLDTLKNILSCAFHEKPIIIFPKFSNKLKSVSTLIDKGVLRPVQNKDGSISYEFLI